MRRMLCKMLQSPFAKLPLVLAGVLVTEHLLLKCYTFLEKTNFNLM